LIWNGPEQKPVSKPLDGARRKEPPPESPKTNQETAIGVVAFVDA